MILRSMRMHPYRACIFLKIPTYVLKYAKIRIRYNKYTLKWQRMSDFRRKLASKSLFIYAGKGAEKKHTLRGFSIIRHIPYVHTYIRLQRMTVRPNPRPRTYINMQTRTIDYRRYGRRPYRLYRLPVPGTRLPDRSAGLRWVANDR
jgi:hypothetical protein